MLNNKEFRNRLIFFAPIPLSNITNNNPDYILGIMNYVRQTRTLKDVQKRAFGRWGCGGLIKSIKHAVGHV